MLDFHTPKVTATQLDERHTVFAVEPLERGFGYTFGNSLRRVLLSSLEGAAISAVKIEGVAHEFSTVPGVKEDVTDIILNLKKVVFVIHGEDNEMNVNVLKEGPGEAYAGDIDTPANVEVVNPEAYIAALEDGARLEMILKIRRGIGFLTADDNRPDETVIGWIAVDSLFSPVTKVAYRVEPARVGQRTDFDKLILDVQTNGAIAPKESVAHAAKLLRDQLQIFIEESAEPEPVVEGLKEQPDSGDTVAQNTDYDDMSIADLDLSVRSDNCLKREGIETVGDLISRTQSELLAIPNFGKKSIDEVRERLARLGLTLRGE